MAVSSYLIKEVPANSYQVTRAKSLQCFYLFVELGQATYFSAICIATVGLPRVQVQINKSPIGPGLINNTQLIVNGSEIDFSVVEENANTTQSIDGINSEIQFERSNSTLTVLFSSGVSLEVTPSSVSY